MREIANICGVSLQSNLMEQKLYIVKAGQGNVALTPAEARVVGSFFIERPRDEWMPEEHIFGYFRVLPHNHRNVYLGTILVSWAVAMSTLERA